MNKWLAISMEGWGKMVAGDPKIRILHELIQNAWDQDVTRVEVILESAPNLGRGLARLKVTDNDTRGFADLSDAFTLFAPSRKASEPGKRGRFNSGNKWALAHCTEATLISTTGTVKFLKDGTRQRSQARTEKGSSFAAVVRMTIAEIAEISEQVLLLIPPAGVHTTYNGTEIPERKALLTFNAQLGTVLADPEGALRPTRRQTDVELYLCLPDDQPMLYELGIPVRVLDSGEPYHVNVLQKIPLNTERDNVSPAFLRELRTYVLNHTSLLLTPEEVKAPWVTEALGDKRVLPGVVVDVIAERFGAKAVAFDPSDQEANHRAAGNDCPVVSGGTFSADAWQNIRKAGALPPAGRKFPTPKVFSDDPDAPTVVLLAESDWTPGIRNVVELAKSLAHELLAGVQISVQIINDPAFGHAACYGKCQLSLNLKALGSAWFDNYATNPEPVLDLLVHEFAHHHAVGSHLADDYHQWATKLGARLAVLALRKPSLFRTKLS